MKTYDVVALGELLIDFTESGLSPQGNPLLEVNPGGAPCNVLSMLQNLGHRTAFLGKVGQDTFGDLLADAISACGIETRGLLRDGDVHTTLAFVHTHPDGDRSFSFYRKPGADVRLTAEELDEGLLTGCRIFHFGTLSLTDEPCRTATQIAVDTARKAGAILSFDPNLREPLWSDLAEAKRQIEWGLARCDILKISDNEVLFVTGETDFEKGAAILLDRFPNIRLLNITAGPDGSHCFFGGRHVFVPGFKVRTIETTGAGDTFCACVLHDVLQNGLENRTDDSLAAMLRFANAAAAIVTTRKGALRSMPSQQDIQTLFS
ncbi:MAG: carbohydrate kinase [Oscillospiraceae bacterium]|nr:carbohydrate kinase [Oscillospiraceae bacterium]